MNLGYSGNDLLSPCHIMHKERSTSLAYFHLNFFVASYRYLPTVFGEIRTEAAPWYPVLWIRNYFFRIRILIRIPFSSEFCIRIRIRILLTVKGYGSSFGSDPKHSRLYNANNKKGIQIRILQKVSDRYGSGLGSGSTTLLVRYRY
jgi:hypothetical protein